MAAELVLQRLKILGDALPDACHGDMDAIHRARVASRRLREALPLLKGTGGRKLERVVRRLTRTLGPVRELDVTLKAIDDLAQAGEVPRAAAAVLRQAMVDERRRLHGEMVREVDRCDIDRLKRRTSNALRSMRSAKKRVAAADAAARLAAAERRAARRAERLAGAIETAASLYLPDRLHEVRIGVKKLRYAMEVVRELRRSRAVARIHTLKRAQDLLGRMHDLEILIARTRAAQGSSNVADLRVSADLDTLVRRLETECRQLHGHYVASRSVLLSICAHVTAEAGSGRGAAA